MTVSRRRILASAVGAAGVTVAGTSAAAGQADNPQVLSGSDIGFRIDRIGADGTVVGALVVRVGGKWVPAQFQPGLRKAT